MNNFLKSHIPFYPSAHRRTDRRLKVVHNRRLLTIGVIGTVLVIGLIVAIICVYVLAIKNVNKTPVVSRAPQTTTPPTPSKLRIPQ